MGNDLELVLDMVSLQITLFTEHGLSGSQKWPHHIICIKERHIVSCFFFEKRQELCLSIKVENFIYKAGC